MQNKFFDPKWGILLILFLAYVVLAHHGGHSADLAAFAGWSKSIWYNGLGNAYGSGTNYLPIYQYILWVFGKFQRTTENIEQNIHTLRYCTLFFDFIGGLFLFKILQEKFKSAQEAFLYSLFFFLNIAYFYNTLVWGQVDGILTTFLLISFYFGLKEKLLLSLAFFVLAINMKLQAIIFLPLLGLVLIPILIQSFSWKKLGLSLITVLSLQLLIIAPFLLKGQGHLVWNAIAGSVGTYPFVSMDAFNFWHWVVEGNLMEVRDDQVWMGLTYKNWGLLMFFGTSFFALWPLLMDVLKIYQKRLNQLSLNKVFIIGAIIPILFFFFNTQMHERYVHPSLLFLAVYSLLNKKCLPYILLSIAYFLNLEQAIRIFDLKNYSVIFFHPSFVAGLYFIVLLLLFKDLYTKPFGREQLKLETDQNTTLYKAPIT